MDSRENRFVRTEIFADEDGRGRVLRISPFEQGMAADEIGQILEVMDSFRTTPPPQSVLGDEERLRSYIERSAHKMLSGRRGAGKDAVGVLTRICAQYSSGYGALEHLLRDERVQDIYVDGRDCSTPVYVMLGGMSDPALEGTYRTNIVLTEEEIERIVSVLRYTSDRPFSEANPVLECDMGLFNARATAVSPPMSNGGISLAIRKHSHDPWTLLSLIGNGALSPLCAGFLNLCVDGRCTMMIAGSRGAGKSSLLGALLFEVDLTQRIIVIEDTPELPVKELSGLGYKVLGISVGQGKGSTPEKALRTALRLGESVLVMGEVRGPETRVLYEAMSAGTAGSSVMGTFHADSAGSVYKRVVNDMGIPPGSFSATDLVVVAGLVRPKGGRARLRRVLEVSELIKTGEPGRFKELFVYDPSTDSLLAGKGLPGSSVLKRIGSSWGLSLEEMLYEVELRGKAFSTAAEAVGRDELRRPSTTVRFCTAFREARERSLQNGWPERTGLVIDAVKEAFGGEWD